VNDKIKYLRMTNMDGYLFERCLVRYVIKKYGGDDPHYSELGRLIFFDQADPATSYRNVRKSGKPRRVNVAEAVRMAEAVGMDIASLCFHVQKEIDNGWTLVDDETPKETKKAGKKTKKAGAKKMLSFPKGAKEHYTPRPTHIAKLETSDGH